MAATTKRKTTKPVAKAAASPASDGPTAAEILLSLGRMGSSGAAKLAQRFFKTGVEKTSSTASFLGIGAPQLRAFVRDLKGAGVEVVSPLLKSGWHEARATGLMLMVQLFKQGDTRTQKRIFTLYLKSMKFINTWALVDMSAEYIVGGWLADKPQMREQILTKLAKSTLWWERRIAVLATFHYIKQGDATEIFRLAKLLLDDKDDLVQKAVGWMLREVGKRLGEREAESFLRRHYQKMPRTMLRYAIERFAEPKRMRYMKGLV